MKELMRLTDETGTCQSIKLKLKERLTKWLLLAFLIIILLGGDFHNLTKKHYSSRKVDQGSGCQDGHMELEKSPSPKGTTNPSSNQIKTNMHPEWSIALIIRALSSG